ncbi:hypothetical protein UYO_2978 [Lachnospiraceae bacterium JC7]|nr:hypothetical protein UYO_2978 [Lachnospiraceae bacterium JC7]
METITLPRFLKIVDGHIKDMSHEELEMLIHEIAATVPEAKRDKFIFDVG